MGRLDAVLGRSPLEAADEGGRRISAADMTDRLNEAARPNDRQVDSPEPGRPKLGEPASVQRAQGGQRGERLASPAGAGAVLTNIPIVGRLEADSASRSA